MTTCFPWCTNPEHHADTDRDTISIDSCWSDEIEPEGTRFSAWLMSSDRGKGDIKIYPDDLRSESWSLDHAEDILRQLAGLVDQGRAVERRLRVA